MSYTGEAEKAVINQDHCSQYKSSTTRNIQSTMNKCGSVICSGELEITGLKQGNRENAAKRNKNIVTRRNLNILNTFLPRVNNLYNLTVFIFLRLWKY